MAVYPILEKVTSATSVSNITKNHAFILEIQTLLSKGGFYKGSIDGFWGGQTDEAFKAFKKAAYLEHPDLLGKSTAEALLEIGGQGEHPTPKDALTINNIQQIIRLPGGRVVRVGELIPGSYNFTWAEATAVGSRVPQDSAVVTKIIQLAQYLDRVKAFFDGRAIRVHSWYRPPAVNKAVGGVSNSTHLLGNGVDFSVAGIAPLEVYRLLDPWHGRIGGLGRSTQFSHLDIRGYLARWKYGS